MTRLEKSSWKRNPCPYLGGSPTSQTDDQSTSQSTVSIFNFSNPNNSFSVELLVTKDGPQCPSCGQTKTQLVRHMKTDSRCKERCERIDFESFEPQLKRFRDTQRKKWKQEENEKDFKEKHRQAEAKRKAKKREDNEEDFKEKHRQEESKRKAKQREDNEEEFKEKHRQEESKRKAKKRKIDEADFKKRHKQEESKRKAKKRKLDEAGFKEKQRQEGARSKAKKREAERGAEGRARKFWRAVMFADIFVCSSCERILFEQNVSPIDGLEEKVEKKKEGLFSKCIPRLKAEALVSLSVDGKTTTKHYVCHACRGHMLKGKMPPMCAENGLRKTAIEDEDMKLTELERNMIALRIPFTKMIMLPKTR